MNVSDSECFKQTTKFSINIFITKECISNFQIVLFMHYRRKMESTESTHNTKISDSAYSNSCSNSQSQRSGSSSKSRHSNSSASSGYGGKAPTNNAIPQPLSKRSKDRKKKKLKSTIQASTSTIADDTQQQRVDQEVKSDKVEINVAGML